MNFKVFSFKPKKLNEVTKEIKETFPDSRKLAGIKEVQYSQYLDEVLKAIEKTGMGKLKPLAIKLKKKYIYCLVNNVENINWELLDKVIKILEYRCNRKIIQIMWKKYCLDFKNKYFIDFFKRISKEIKKFNFVKPPFSLLDEIFSEQPLEWIIDFILTEDLTYKKGMEHFNIETNSQIAMEICKKFFTVQDKKRFIAEEKNEFLSVLQKQPLENFKEIIDTYLKVLSLDELNSVIMKLVKKRLGDPTKVYSTGWDQLSLEAKKKAKQWFINNELVRFFENVEATEEEAKRRFYYWRNYLEFLEDAKFISDGGNDKLVLIFKNIIVVEFARTGNAAYIYERNIFEGRYGGFLKNGKYYKIIFKNRNINLDRIIHQGNWEWKADRLIKKFL